MAGIDYTGRTLDKRYRVLELLGRGGMGAVYRGEHTLIGRKLAIKILHGKFVGDEEMVTRFYREARAAAAIGHKNIIEVLDVGATDEGDPFIVMEYLEGESLGAMLKRVGPLDLPTACGILEPVLLALIAAHKAGIVHRDLKPDNVFLAASSDDETDETEVKLIDFGISKVARDIQETQLTLTGHVLGTPAYMSPEQAMGAGVIDHRVDIYSLGVILYQMLTGKLPFESDNYNALLAKILTGDPTPPEQANPEFPTAATRVIERAMSREPDERYADVKEMLEDIKRLEDFDSRREKMRTLASSIVQSSLAIGDLGGEATGDSSKEGVAAEAMAKIAGDSTPSEWARTSARPGGKRRGLPVPMIVAALVLAAGAVAVVVLTQDGIFEEPVPVEPSAAGQAEQKPAPEPDTVRVEIKGAPQGAQVFYDGGRVLMNPFNARKVDAVVPLRVEAEGFVTYAGTLVPSEDRVVEVELSPLPAAPEEPDAGAAVAEEPEKKPVKKGKGKPRPAGEKKGEFVKKFE
jgi:serine/threonine-protein kinase